MCESIIPSSANWYCPHVSDYKSKIFCFAARCNIYVFDVQHDFTFLSCIITHCDRVLGVSLKPLKEIDCCVSVGDDKKVKQWNIITGNLVAEHSNHQVVPTAVHWNVLNPVLVASADEKGHIFIWNLSTNKCDHLYPESNGITVLSWSLHESNLLAAGYKTGTIVLLDITKKSSLLLKWRGHEADITALSWCSEEGDEHLLINSTNLEPSSAHHYAIASASRDKTIRVWSSRNERCLHVLKVPSGAVARRNRQEDGHVKPWVAMCWPSGRPCSLLSSSLSGDMLLWDVKSGRWQVFETQSSSACHNRLIFTITQGGPENTNIITTSLDRKIVLWSLTDNCSLVSQPCFGGHVYALSLSPVNTGCVAIGVGDNAIHFWQKDSSDYAYDIKSVWQGIKAKVTTICWHPIQENLLAFGTDDGKVGIVNCGSGKVHVSSTYHKRTVYCVCWGPPCSTKGDSTTHVVYSVGDGVVLWHDPKALDREGGSATAVINETSGSKDHSIRTEMSWNHDFSVVAVGNSDGLVEILQPPNFRRLCVIHCHRKLITSLKWHPAFTGDSSQLSPCNYWLASASYESVIYVIDLKTILDSVAATEKIGDSVAPVITESMCRLSGHSNRVTCVSWSCHRSGLLASASYDCTVQVWDIIKQCPVINYRNHSSSVLCVLWDVCDSDLVYSGGEDSCLQVWRPSKQLHKLPPTADEKKVEKVAKKASKSKSGSINKRSDRHSTSSGNVDKKDSTDVGKDVSAGVSADVSKDVSIKELERLLALKEESLKSAATTCNNLSTTSVANELEAIKPIEAFKETEAARELSTVSFAENNDIHTSAEEDAKLKHRKTDAKRDRVAKRRKAKSLFPISSAKENCGKASILQDIIEMTKLMVNDFSEVPANSHHLGYLVNRKSVLQLINDEDQHHKSNESHDQHVILHSFTSDLESTLREAAGRGELSDWLVSLAPSVSPVLWRDMCISYAKQLAEDGSHHRAVTYLLSAGQVYEALTLLRDHGFMKDAVTLAQLRLSPLDPFLHNLISDWATMLARDGNFEAAAKCYLSIKQPKEAIRLLASRQDLSSQKTAIEIAALTNDITAIKIHSQKYVSRCLEQFDWTLVCDLVTLHPSLLVYATYTCVHATLLSQLPFTDTSVCLKARSFLDHLKTSGFPVLLVDVKEKDDLLPWQPKTVNGELFIVYLLRIWLGHWAHEFEQKSSLQQLTDELQLLKQGRQKVKEFHELLIHVSLDISYAVARLLLGDCTEALLAIAEAISTLFQAGYNDEASHLCLLVVPQGVKYLNRIQQQCLAIAIASKVQMNRDQLPASKNIIESETENEWNRLLKKLLNVVFHTSIARKEFELKNESMLEQRNCQQGVSLDLCDVLNANERSSEKRNRDYSITVPVKRDINDKNNANDDVSNIKYNNELHQNIDELKLKELNDDNELINSGINCQKEIDQHTTSLDQNELSLNISNECKECTNKYEWSSKVTSDIKQIINDTLLTNSYLKWDNVEQVMDKLTDRAIAVINEMKTLTDNYEALLTNIIDLETGCILLITELLHLWDQTKHINKFCYDPVSLETHQVGDRKNLVSDQCEKNVEAVSVSNRERLLRRLSSGEYMDMSGHKTNLKTTRKQSNFSDSVGGMNFEEEFETMKLEEDSQLID